MQKRFNIQNQEILTLIMRIFIIPIKIFKLNI